MATSKKMQVIKQKVYVNLCLFLITTDEFLGNGLEKPIYFLLQ